MSDGGGVSTSPERVKYLIFGCGSTGYNIAEELAKETDEIVIVDKDEKRVGDLIDQKYNAIVYDINNPWSDELLPVPDFAFVMSNDKAANKSFVKSIKSAHPSTHIIARAVDAVSVDMLEEAGADYVIFPQETVAKKAIHHAFKLQSSLQARKLYNLIAGWEGNLAIITHTNPDPDSISSAMALVSIVENAAKGKLKCHIIYDGNIGHQENKAFVNLLEIDMIRSTPELLCTCDYIALVDSPAPGINNCLEKSDRVNILIDHHANGDEIPMDADFIDMRIGIGATASILTQYLIELDLPVDKKVATALLYGIKADTRDFRRNVTPSDLNYAAFLLPLTDGELLAKITTPALSEETLDIIGKAINNRKARRGGYLFSNVGYIRNRDTLPQAADMLINLEGVNTALVYGISDEMIYLSARSKDVRLHIGNTISEAFGQMGDAGGHATMAAAAIPLSFFSKVKNKEELLSLIIDPLLHEFTRVAGIEDEESSES